MVVLMQYQGSLFEGWDSSVKDKDGFDVVMQQLTDTRKQESKMGRLQRPSFSIPHPMYSLVQPYAHVWEIEIETEVCCS